MTFLNPAVLFGLIATAIPVLIHLLNLRKLKKIDFSTLQFLKELQKNKIRKIKVKQWLLLALRVLIILFIVGAFARPAISNFSLGGTASAAKTTAVFILDNTFSMSQVDENGSQFNKAKQVIKNIFYELQEGDEAALITTSDMTDSDVQPTSNLIELRKKIEAERISASSGTLNNAILKAARILGESKNFNKEIYVLSDLQKSRLTDKEKSFSDLSSMLDEKVKLYFFDFSNGDHFNLGITNFELNNQIFEKDKTISFSTDIKNYSAQAANNIIASLFINGERSAQQSISLQQGASGKFTFETVLKQTGIISASVEIEDDDILQDNKRSLLFEVPDKISVIIFNDYESDVKYPELALSAQSGIEITKRNFNQIQSVNLSNYNAVILIGYKTGAMLERISTYISNGGGVLVMPGSNSTISDIRELNNGLKIPIPNGSGGSINSNRSSAIFDEINFDHPIFTGLFENTSKKKIESPEIYYYFKMLTLGRGKNIINLIDNSSFLSEYSVGKGKLLFINTAPVLSWSNFPVKGIFVPIITKSVFYLSSREQNVNNYIAGNEVNISVQNTSLPQLKIILPDKNEEYINLNEKINQSSVSFNSTGMTGNYLVYSGDKLINHFSVNNDPRESDTKRVTDEELKDYLKAINFQGNSINLKPQENYVKQIQQARFGSELWKLFLLLAFAIAIIEMLIARSSKKDLT